MAKILRMPCEFYMQTVLKNFEIPAVKTNKFAH